MRRRKSIYELMRQEFLNLSELGQLFGTTGPRVGRHFADEGLWLINDGPTEDAGMLDLVRQRHYADDRPDDQVSGEWHRVKAIEILRSRGLKLVEP